MAEPMTGKMFRLPSDLAYRLETAAKEAGVSQTDIVVEAIRNWLEAHDSEDLQGNALARVRKQANAFAEAILEASVEISRETIRNPSSARSG